MHRKFNDDIFARCLVIMNIEGRLWGHPVTSSRTSSSWKYFFLHNLGRYYHIWGQIEAVFHISTFFKMAAILSSRQNFFHRKLFQKQNIPER